MECVFDFKTAQQYDSWYDDPRNRFVSELEDQLLLKLLEPVPGERLLDIGCGTGRHLLMFLEMGLEVTGFDRSPYMLGIAKERVGHRAALYQGVAEDLPFEDNSFNIATLITTLEFVDDPQQAIQEACRVAKDRIFLGVLNRYSIKGIERKLKGMFSESVYNHAQFFSVWRLKQYVRQVLGKTPLRWGTVYSLPVRFMKCTRYVERCSLVQRLPFGGFIGMVITLMPRYHAGTIPLKYIHDTGGAMPGLIQTPTHSQKGG